jgi:Bacterial TSP3 repeat
MKLRCSWLLFVGALLAVPVAFTLTQSTGLDSDGDGLTDVREALLGTDPHRPDTDGDGLLDSWEVEWLQPLDRGRVPLASERLRLRRVQAHQEVERAFGGGKGLGLRESPGSTVSRRHFIGVAQCDLHTI